MKQFFSLINDLVEAWREAKEWQAKHDNSNGHSE